MKFRNRVYAYNTKLFKWDTAGLHGKQQQGRGVEYHHTRINDDYQQYILQEEIVLKSKVWVIVGIAIGAVIALAISISIYVYLQMQQGVIV